MFLPCVSTKRLILGDFVGILCANQMSKKQNLLSYFSPVSRNVDSKRRKGNEEEHSLGQHSANKCQKKDDAENSRSISESRDAPNESQKTQLSPEQKQRIDENKKKALARLQGQSNDMVSTMGETWRDALQTEFSKDYFIKLKKFVDSERKSKTIYPPENDVFSWTKLCQMEDVKVVIIGQDPYHGPRQAHGLCFSVRPGVQSPPSLVNIFKELKNDIDGFEIPDHGYLVGWAKQGVLLLNAVLTVVAHNANSHQGKGWEFFTDAVIKKINVKLNNVVFLLWGAYAQKKGASIDKKRHCVLKGPHPSPLSAHRGFFGCKHFSQANKYLKEHDKKEINWSHLPKDIID